jgi:DNA replication protein DnaC
MRDHAHAEVCGCAQACRYCGGAGYVYSQRQETFSERVGARHYETLAPCVCRILKARVECYSEAAIPGVLAHATFENFRAFNEAQHAAKQAAIQFAHAYKKSEPSGGFILSGPVGTGKTHLLVAALGHLILEVGVRARYVEISLLYATIRRGFQEGKSGGEIIGPLSQVDVLAIDELGKGRGSPFELETLDELIARRYNAGKTTLLGTNYSLEPAREAPRSVRNHRTTEELKGAAKEPELLRERVGERIYSRLCEMCDFLSLPPQTPDQRRTKQELSTRSRPHRAG